MNLEIKVNKESAQNRILKFRPIDKNLAYGMRNISSEPLTEEEIVYVLKEAKRIGINDSFLVFNDPVHLKNSKIGTCYDPINDKIFITKNIFPDIESSSTHPRDIMSVAAVLAHEYYGHRTYRNEYLKDNEKFNDKNYYWQDECRASITAAEIAKNLTQREKSDLIMDAVYRAKEAGQILETNDFMKEVLYGYKSTEKSVARLEPITYLSIESYERIIKNRENGRDVSEMQNESRNEIRR